MVGGALLELKDLNVLRGSREVLKDVNFKLNYGEIVVLVGDNGAGKSTFIESCAGIVPFKNGELYFHDEENSQNLIRNHQGRQSNIPKIGVTLQKDGICGEETVEERILIASEKSSKNSDADKLGQILSDWGLNHRKSDRVSLLSGGLKRRLSVICGLAPAIFSPKPMPVLLDEPSVGLDKSARILFINWIRTMASRGHGIIIATHNNDVIKCADRIIKIGKKGKIKESIGKSEGTIVEMPTCNSSSNLISIRDLTTWAMKMEIRNPTDTVGRATPALVALLLSYSLIEGNGPLSVDILSSLILLPAFITCIISPAIINRFNEAECGKWWHIMLGSKIRPISSFLGASMILPIPLTYLSWFILIGNKSDDYSYDALLWLWLPTLSLITVGMASSALHFLVSDLRRSNSSSGSLLLIALIWPFLELSDALSILMTSGMSYSLSMQSPIIGCIIASISSILIWIVVVYLPDY